MWWINWGSKSADKRSHLGHIIKPNKTWIAPTALTEWTSWAKPKLVTQVRLPMPARWLFLQLHKMGPQPLKVARRVGILFLFQELLKHFLFSNVVVKGIPFRWKNLLWTRSDNHIWALQALMCTTFLRIFFGKVSVHTPNPRTCTQVYHHQCYC